MTESKEIIFEEDSLFDYVYPEGKLRECYSGWEDFFNSTSCKKELNRVSKELNSLSDVLPSIPLVFKAFELTPYDKIAVVIVGQDPYPDKGSAMGLCFSIFKGRKINASMQRIRTLLKKCDFKVKDGVGDLSEWASQGVFLPNSAFTVGEGKPESHINIWRSFFWLLLDFISGEHIVWLLFGAKAHSYSDRITSVYKIKTTHPVAFVKSSDPTVKQFSESACFSRCNQLLIKNGKQPIKFDLL